MEKIISLINEVKAVRAEKRAAFMKAHPIPGTPERRQWRELSNRLANISDDGDLGFLTYWQNRVAWLRGIPKC